MDHSVFEVSPHIKWSINKFGAIVIYDRTDKKTFLIDTITGKEIWEGILRKATLKQLAEEIKQKFKTGKSLDEIEHEVTDFINDLAKTNIIHTLKENSS